MTKIRCASFDIGKKNFAFCIEEFDRDEIINLDYVKENVRYNPDGTPTEEFGKIIEKVCLNGKVILYDNVDLTYGCENVYLDRKTFHNMTEVLDKYVKYWDTCDVFVVEEQMLFGKKRNPMAVKLGQHCMSYFMFKYSIFKDVIEFPSYHKTIVLGAEKEKKLTKTGKVTYKAVNKTKRKKWSAEKALDILTERDDFETLSKISSRRKKDDLGDVLCQAQAFKILAYIDKKY